MRLFKTNQEKADELHKEMVDFFGIESIAREPITVRQGPIKTLLAALIVMLIPIR